MQDLIAPHGGVSEPVNRTAADLGGPFAKTIALSDADLSSLYRLGDGALSPLTGPMSAAEWNQVLDEEVIVRNGKNRLGEDRAALVPAIRHHPAVSSQPAQMLLDPKAHHRQFGHHRGIPAHLRGADFLPHFPAVDEQVKARAVGPEFRLKVRQKRGQRPGVL